ncbi:phage portal protein family protein [Tistrella mobilis]|uniref:phage portal protein family protein n=1 Tax=Tistrella mobilis TaxID=171437 RepID=UPI0009DB1F5E|nr:DUF935 family protein [Tistrella mobilis]
MASKITTAEIAAPETDPWVQMYTGVLAPQDPTLARRGGAQGVALYDELLIDPLIMALLEKRTLGVTSREWRVDRASDARADRSTALAVEAQIRAMNHDQATKGLIAGAVVKGHAIGEAMWARRDSMFVVDRIKVRNQRRWRFAVDGSPRLLTRGNTLTGIAVPDRKIIVHRHQIHGHDDDPYGSGIGQSLYWPAWMKRVTLAAWVQAVERYADPMKVATYDGNMEEKTQDQLLRKLMGLVRGGAMVLPRSVEVALHKAEAGDYEPLLRYLDEMITIAILGETLTTSAGDHGARALGDVHNEIRTLLAKADADLICQTFNETMVRWIVDANALPIKAGYPQVWRDFSEPEDLNQLSQRDERLAQMGFRPTAKYIAETYGGDRVDTQAPPPAEAAPPDPAFAEAAATAAAIATQRVPEVLTARLIDATADARRQLIERVREVVMAATSYDDLAVRLLEALPGLDVTALGEIMTEAMATADLIGRSAVLAEGADDGDS